MSKHSEHTWVVDVIEEGSASIEVDGRSVTPIPAWLLPEGVKEGDVLSVTHDRGEGKSAVLIEIDPEAKKKALDKSAKQVSKKSKNDRGGDIQLDGWQPISFPSCIPPVARPDQSVHRDQCRRVAELS
jgi:Protein of unknown function (DUF3006)